MAHAHDDVESIRKQTKIYLFVFLALAALTIVTVGVAYLHMPPVMAVVVALLIAGIKGSLVAGFFMHLIAERKAIYWILVLTVVFFIVLLFYPALDHWDQLMTREPKVR